MGLSSKSTTQTTKPIYGPQIEGQAGNLAAVGAANQAVANQNQGALQGLIPTLLASAKNGNPAVNAAQGYITDTLSHDPAQNPWLDQVIARQQRDIPSQVLASLGMRGLSGGSAATDMISRNLADTEMNARFTDWNNGQTRRAQAAGMAPGVAAGNLAPIASLLGVAQTSTGLPLSNALPVAAGVGGLLGNYTNTTQKQSGGLLGDLLGAALSGWASGGFALSDRNAKEDIREVGKTFSGLPIYTFRYKGDETMQMGVMAQDVETMQPAALGPVVGGFKTVRYGEVR